LIASKNLRSSLINFKAFLLAMAKTISLAVVSGVPLILAADSGVSPPLINSSA